MRKQNKEILDQRVIESLLQRVDVAYLATIAPDGWPVVKPLNFCWNSGRLYFHSARQGEKLDHIRANSRVSLALSLPIAYVRGGQDNPCAAEFLYQSVIVRGHARLVEDDRERIAALSALMAKYQPEGGYGAFLQEKLELTAVVAIDIVEMVGKEDLGKGALREAALAALSGGGPLPVTLDR